MNEEERKEEGIMRKNRHEEEEGQVGPVVLDYAEVRNVQTTWFHAAFVFESNAVRSTYLLLQPPLQTVR